MPRPLLKKPQSPLASNHLVDDKDDDTDDIILDMHVGHRRPMILDDDGEQQLSNYILDRLQDARILALAMLK